MWQKGNEIVLAQYCSWRRYTRLWLVSIEYQGRWDSGEGVQASWTETLPASIGYPWPQRTPNSRSVLDRNLLLSDSTMIPLPDVQSLDFRIDTKFPAGLVTAFVTITSGTRKHTRKPFVKHARRPRVCLWPLQKSWQFYCNTCPKLNSATLYTIIRSETGLDPKKE